MRVIFLLEEYGPPWNEGYKNTARYFIRSLIRRGIVLDIIEYKQTRHLLKLKSIIEKISSTDDKIVVINFNYPFRNSLLMIKTFASYFRVPVFKYHMKSDFLSLRSNVYLILHDALLTSSRLLTYELKYRLRFKKNPYMNVEYVGVPIPTDYYYEVSNSTKKMIRDEFKLGSEDFIITYTGRIYRRKEVIITLINTIKFIQRNNFNIKILVCVSSEAEKQLLEKVFTNKFGQDINSVRIISSQDLNKNDVRYIYWASDLLLYPVKEENAVQPPLTVLEALSCAIPVIARHSIGVREVIMNCYNGFIYESDNGLQKLIELIANMNSSEIEKLRHNARRFVVEKFAADKVSNRIIDVIERYS